MLSTELTNLRELFVGEQPGGLLLHPELCDQVAAILADGAAQARQLEAQPVPAAARVAGDVSGLGGNVVALDGRRGEPR
jgi:hypothetical protein